MLSRAHLDHLDPQARQEKRVNLVYLGLQESMGRRDLKVTWVRQDLLASGERREKWGCLGLLVWTDTKERKATAEWMITWFR